MEKVRTEWSQEKSESGQEGEVKQQRQVQVARKAGQRGQGAMREAREWDHNAKDESIGGITNDVDDLSKELEMARDKTGTDKAAFASNDDKSHRLPSDIDRGKKRGKENQRATADRSEAVAERERDRSKRQQKSRRRNMEEDTGS